MNPAPHINQEEEVEGRGRQIQRPREELQPQKPFAIRDHLLVDPPPERKAGTNEQCRQQEQGGGRGEDADEAGAYSVEARRLGHYARLDVAPLDPRSPLLPALSSDVVTRPLTTTRPKSRRRCRRQRSQQHRPATTRPGAGGGGGGCTVRKHARSSHPWAHK